MTGNDYQKRPTVWAGSREEAETWIEENIEEKKNWEQRKPDYTVKELKRA